MDRSKSSRRPTHVELDLKIELGRARIDGGNLCDIGLGSVVALNTLVSDPVDIVADGGLVARGEILVLDGKLCVRIVELVGDKARITSEAA